MPYIIADTPEAAVRVITLVPEAAFSDLDKARNTLTGYPSPNPYRVYHMTQAPGPWVTAGEWRPDQFHGFSGGRDD